MLEVPFEEDLLHQCTFETLSDVLQGTILPAILFSMFRNKLLSFQNKTGICYFTHDNTIFVVS